MAMDGYMTDSAPTPTTMHIDMDPSDKKRGADNAADTMTLVSMPQTSSGTGSWQYIQKTPGQRFKLSDVAKTQTTSWSLQLVVHSTVSRVKGTHKACRRWY